MGETRLSLWILDSQSHKIAPNRSARTWVTRSDSNERLGMKVDLDPRISKDLTSPNRSLLVLEAWRFITALYAWGLHKVSVTTPDMRANREEQSAFSSSAQELCRQDLHLKPYPTKQQRSEEVCLHWSYPGPVPKRPYDSHLGLNLAHISRPNDTADPSSTGYCV